MATRTNWVLVGIKSPAAIALLAFISFAVLHGTAWASTGPYSGSVFGDSSTSDASSTTGQEAAGAIDALRRYWALPVLAAISGIATIIGVFGLLFQGEKKDLFERLFTYGGIAFLGTGFSTLIVVAIAAYAKHVQVQGAIIH